MIPEGFDMTRFWRRVRKGVSCWDWTGSVNPQGYGHIYVEGKMVPAHRFSYAALVKDIPDGLVIDHQCFNRSCVNPSHLRAVTRRENAENRAGPRKNTGTGVRGVRFDKVANRYIAYAGSRGVQHYGGSYRTLGEAASAAVALRNAVHTNNTLDRMSAEEG